MKFKWAPFRYVGNDWCKNIVFWLLSFMFITAVLMLSTAIAINPLNQFFPPKEFGLEFKQNMAPITALITLLTISVAISVVLMALVTDQAQLCIKSTAFFLLLTIALTVGLISQGGRYLDGMVLFDDLRAFRNLDDPKMDVLKTYYLALFNECCNFLGGFFGRCSERGEPCFSDNDLYFALEDTIGFFRKDCRVVGRLCSSVPDFDVLVEAGDDIPRFISRAAGKMHRKMYNAYIMNFVAGIPLIAITSFLFIKIISVQDRELRERNRNQK